MPDITDNPWFSLVTQYTPFFVGEMCVLIAVVVGYIAMMVWIGLDKS